MERLSFKVSSGLKNIIGRELITDKIIAIFELVKNSYDAGAKRVDIIFNNIKSEDAEIIISDDGCGMNKQDLVNKWLFVAYSEKKENRKNVYLKNINTLRTYAGAKGVGRFSCDRLGHSLRLYSRKAGERKVNLLDINWDDFEKNLQEEFVSISVGYKYVDELPSKNSQGTSVVISRLREKWCREDILALKKSLIKLLNPYESNDDIFDVVLHCEEEEDNDKKEQNDREKINGKLKNYIFEDLNLKTTQISVVISEDGKTIKTTMYDRGMYLFELVQVSNFLCLKNIRIELFYLNRSAKINFRKIMGISPVEFGSIFVYKNGFRIMPYGEPGADIFQIDRRKQQGYNRYLGTRDLMGRIIVLGDNPDFVETSSRDGGFIRTEAFDELDDFYRAYAHIPLEKYVVNLIKWGDATDTGVPEISPINIKEQIVRYVTEYEKKGRLISVHINEQFLSIVEKNKEEKSNEVVNEIRNIAKQYGNKELDRLAQRVEQRNRKLEKERKELVKQFESTSGKLEMKEEELQVTKKQVKFLKGLSDPKFENATETLHMMNTYAKSIKLNINRINHQIKVSEDKKLFAKLNGNIYEIIKAVRKINTMYTFAFAADYNMKQQSEVFNLPSFIKEFVENALFSKAGEILKVNIKTEEESCYVRINPIEFSMIIEDIIYNSYKARAKNLDIIIGKDKDYISIEFRDDGIGLSKVVENMEQIFELGYTTTNGTGVGLSHAKKTIEQWGGTIEVVGSPNGGFILKMRLKNEYEV